MDEIEKRLRETSEHCFNCYEAWQKDKKNSEAREGLAEAIHELRKVASRLEIELGVSERDEAKQKPIPIPSHRDAQRRPRDDNRGNKADNASKGGGTKRKRPPKKSAEN